MKESNFQSYSTVASWLPWYKARSNLLIKVVHVSSMSTWTTPTAVSEKITNVRSACHIFYQLFQQICPCIVRYTWTRPLLSFCLWKIHCWKTSNLSWISLQSVAPVRWQLSLLRSAKNKQNQYSCFSHLERSSTRNKQNNVSHLSNIAIYELNRDFVHDDINSVTLQN